MGEDRLKLNKLRRKRELKRLSYLIFAIAIFIIILSSIHVSSLKSKETSRTIVHSASKANPPLKKQLSQGEEVNNDPAINDYLKGLHFTGTALVVKDNKVILNKGFGFADSEKQIANNDQTVFYIGSISKVFISTAIMQQQEKGKLRINDPLSKYIPDFPNGKNITLYHLLTHTSGIAEHAETAQQISHDELIKKIEKGPQKFPPGTNWLYSDSNYAILAYILEKVTGVKMEAYVNKNIFEIAGMKHSGFGEAFYNEPFPSKGYKIKNGVMMSPPLPDMSQLFGCGDVYTSPYDMYLFDHALYSGKLLSEESLKQFFTPFKHNYAFGVYSDPGSYSDHGVLPGWNCLNSFSKKGGTYVVLFSNVQNEVKSLGVINNQIYIMTKKK